MASSSSSATILPTQTIKALLDTCTLSSLPSQYTSRNHDPDYLVPVVDEEDIPIVDFSLLSSEDTEKRQQALDKLDKACKEWGFFMVMNHGIEESLKESMIEACKRFFDMPEEEKWEFSGTSIWDPIRCGTSFNTSVEDVRFWRDYLKIVAHPEFYSPSKPHGFREIAQEFTTRVRELAMALLRVMWENLGLDQDYMVNMLNLNNCFQFVAANLYPPCPQPEHAMGLPSHSDLGLLTVLTENGVQGLQVKHRGKWVRIKPLPNTVVINIADHMEIVTNGRYKSVFHRVEVNNTSTRISIAVDILPSLAAVIAPAEQLLKDEPASYRPVVCKEYFKMRQSTKLISSFLERFKI